jgi:Ser/Thr protein kinase RdoA (MazF antagonist)
MVVMIINGLSETKERLVYLASLKDNLNIVFLFLLMPLFETKI